MSTEPPSPDQAEMYIESRGARLRNHIIAKPYQDFLTDCARWIHNRVEQIDLIDDARARITATLTLSLPPKLDDNVNVVPIPILYLGQGAQLRDLFRYRSYTWDRALNCAIWK